ncbi:MAG: type II secretion system protein, partial [Nitrosomonas sp.]|nr:type II secretion system protein [Nitrosomonas sp.]
LFVGEEFREAFMSYYNGTPGNVKEYPDSLEELLHDTRAPVLKRHLRRIYLDPMTNTLDWGLVEEPEPEEIAGFGSRAKKGIIGVYSLSEKTPIKKGGFPEHYKKFSDALTYQDWQFVYTQDAGAEEPLQTQLGSDGLPSASPVTTRPAASGFTPKK